MEQPKAPITKRVENPFLEKEAFEIVSTARPKKEAAVPLLKTPPASAVPTPPPKIPTPTLTPPPKIPE